MTINKLKEAQDLLSNIEIKETAIKVLQGIEPKPRENTIQINDGRVFYVDEADMKKIIDMLLKNYNARLKTFKDKFKLL